MSYQPTCGNRKCGHPEAMHRPDFVKRPDPTTGEEMTVVVRACAAIGCRCKDYREGED